MNPDNKLFTELSDRLVEASTTLLDVAGTIASVEILNALYSRALTSMLAQRFSEEPNGVTIPIADLEIEGAPPSARFFIGADGSLEME